VLLIVASSIITAVRGYLSLNTIPALLVARCSLARSLHPTRSASDTSHGPSQDHAVRRHGQPVCLPGVLYPEGMSFSLAPSPLFVCIHNGPAWMAVHLGREERMLVDTLLALSHGVSLFAFTCPSHSGLYMRV